MATRDLTRAFLQLRADEKAKVLRRKNIVSHREEGNALMKSADQDAASVTIAPGWVDVVAGTNQHVARIKEMSTWICLSKLHTSRLMVRFDGSESKYEQEIGQVTQEITDEFRSAEKGLRRMAQSERGGNFSAADAKTRQNVQRCTLSDDFRKSQKTYLARVKNQKEGPVEFDFLSENEAKQKRRSGGDMGFSQAQVTEVEIAEDLINERDEEIQRIATSITELATIFKELAVLVIDQGTILDRIDYNMEQVVEQTEKGIEELEKAEKTQKNSRPMKCIGLLLVMIFVMTLLLVLKHSMFLTDMVGLMETEVARQQSLMRSLRVFVDALRDIKELDDTAVVNRDVVQAVRALCAASGDANGQSEQQEPWHELVWRRGLVPTFQRLCLCMTHLDELEAEQKKKQQFGPQTPKQAARPTAPAGLLSLRDYSVLQAAVELLFCWGAHPRVASGILLSIEKRRPTRTLDIAKSVLLWGSRAKMIREDEEEERVDELLEITQALLQLLSLPQFQPILLPKYVVELLALLVYGEVAMDTATLAPVHTEFVRLRGMVLRVLPLRMGMSSLRAALGQATPVASDPPLTQRFKARCGHLLSQLLMEDGGVVATIEMLLGAVDEGNTQARMQVATLICQCPSGEDPDKYARSLCSQVRELLLAAVTPEKGNTSSKLLGEMAALLTDQMATRHPSLFDTQLLAELFRPLLLYEDSRVDIRSPAEDTSEMALMRCVGIGQLLLCGPPPSQRLLQALAPIVRPLLHMYAFAATSKSFLATPLRALLIAWVRSCAGAVLLLQVAVLPVTPPIQSTLISCGYERKPAEATEWRPLREFCAGGSGGIALRLRETSSELGDDGDDATGQLKVLVMPLVELLNAGELENSEVVGKLFTSLLLTYMKVRRQTEGGEAEDRQEQGVLSSMALYEAVKTPTSAAGIEMVLTLLLALIECLGPSVLRSAVIVLQCIATVLETYNAPTMKLVDRELQSDENRQATIAQEAEEEEEGDEILTICLGVVMTILEAGSARRSTSEEQQLRTMLPILEVLSHHPRPEVAELASDARVQILSRGAVAAAGMSSGAIGGEGQQTFDQVLREVEKDLASQLVPLRARGVASLTKLVRRSHAHARDLEWVPRVHALTRVFLLHLRDAESYVFLAAVQGLAALADTHADVAVPALVEALRDSRNSLETRIKLSEALQFAAKRCGETLPKFAKLFVYAYLDCIRPPPSKRKQAARIQEAASKRVQLIQEVPSSQEAVAVEEAGDEEESEEELLAAATLRASCLSNLAEVCALLQWGLQPFLLDVLTCAFGVLQLELERESKRGPSTRFVGADADEGDEFQQKLERHQEEERQQRVVAVRRGAVFVLRYLVELLGWKVLELMPEQLAPLYHTLKHVARVDRDRVVVFHAKRALDALGDVMRAELFPRVDEQDAAFGLSSLRIL
ncbi:hypothetical protein BBJ28_00009726 [Nothophytophthora sp. Chile5]|nr:hypothetical protein BBJ28_00009726 [Nothophytophthora sp. Chile5]